MLPKTLDTQINNVKNVQRYLFGSGSLASLPNVLPIKGEDASDSVIYFVDEFFAKSDRFLSQLPITDDDKLIFISVAKEPTTDYVDSLVTQIRKELDCNPKALGGMGGGTTLDATKAVSNLLTNEGLAQDYQGWDLVKKPGVFKIGIPTLSGTGAEATRTCVMTNKKTGIKLGMNSDYTVFDQVILDPDLTESVPKEQYFYTGMDAYIHCVEALAGSYRNAIGDGFARETISLCKDVFLSDDIQSSENREKLMVASYLGGCSIATSYVGVVHPFSAGLSVVLGVHHCVANCITMRGMKEFYPAAYDEFWSCVEKHDVDIPKGLCRNLTDLQHEELFNATIVHEKPLTNALGEGFKEILTRERVREIFLQM